MEFVSARRESGEDSPTGRLSGGLISPGYKRMSYASDHLPVIQSAPGSVASEDVDDDAFLEEEELPWYHQQLYKLYGQDADYFLYPKTEDEIEPELDAEDRFSHLRNSEYYFTLRWQLWCGAVFTVDFGEVKTACIFPGKKYS